MDITEILLKKPSIDINKKNIDNKTAYELSKNVKIK